MVINKNGDNYIVFIYKKHLDDVDIFDYQEISIFFKSIISKLISKYNISGLCKADVYVNDDLGMIIEINNISINSDILDVKVNIHMDYIFFSEINYINDYDDVYYYNGKYYTIYKDNIDSNVIYKNSLDIINGGIKIK